MDNNLIWQHLPPHYPKTLPQKLHNYHLHSGLALSMVALLALGVGIFTSTLGTEINATNDSLTMTVYFKKLRAAEPLRYLRDLKSVDVMKMTKDRMKNQPTDAEIDSLTSALANNLSLTHIALSIPMDASLDYDAADKPAPRTAEGFTQKWADSIHNQGLKVIWRGTFSGIEGLYNFQWKVGANRFPAGTAATAATDGQSTWLSKIYSYIVNHPGYFKDGDIWAPLPERTENIFQDSTSFLPYDGPGIQANYANFFNDLKTVSDQAFAVIGKKVVTGWSTNNFSEVQSGWLYSSIYSNAGLIVVDYYGTNHSVSEMDSALRQVASQYGKQIFLQEWSDYWDGQLSQDQRTQYLNSMYAEFQKLSNDGVLAGFNYWGGWPGLTESIVNETNGSFDLNYDGQILGSFYAANVPLTPPPADPPVATTTRPSTTTTPPVVAAPPAAILSTGSLAQDNSQLFYIFRGTKVQFASLSVFLGLGYPLDNAISANLVSYPLALNLRLTSANQAHPLASWLSYHGKLYYMHSSGLIPVPDNKTMLVNGGQTAWVVSANKADAQILQNSKKLAPLTAHDSRVY